MKQLKKTILTLVALLAMTAGAWAESKPIGLNVEYAAGDEITSTTDVYVYYGEQPGTLKKMGVKITSTQPLKIFMIHAHGFELNGDAAVYYLPDGVATGGYAGGISCFGESTGDATVVHVASGSGTLTDPYVFGFGPFGTPVPLTQGTGEKINEWTLTNGMPAGNVEVSVDYFAQAELAMSTGTTPVALAPAAIADVPANTDDPIVTAGTVANIGTSEVKQGTLMYFVKQSTGNTAPDAPGYNTEGWSENVPTANGLAQGDAYVWYYIKGAEPANIADRTDDNTRSDSPITALGTNGIVTLDAEPTYDVTLNAEGLSDEEAANWKAATGDNDPAAFPLEGVKKGQTVTVTYSGTRHVKGLKAEKKAAAKTLSEATLEDIGKIAGADGNIYDTKAAAEAVATGNAVAMIAYVGSASDCTHGLAIALADESGTKTWSEAGAACSGKTAVTGGTWRLPSIKDWQYMFIGCGASGSYSDSPSTMSYSELATKLTTANGTALQTVSYWSSTESSPGEDAWSLYFGGSSASFFSGDYEGDAYPIRACLVF